jgi:ABC-type transporter Mla subunit MlaD
MTRQAIVGLFTILALLGLFAIFFVLTNVGPQGRYKIAVHFKSAAGLHKGALVYESGVVVGLVDSTVLRPDDFSVDVYLAINNNVDIPRTAKFLIQAPLTGDSSLEIVPPPHEDQPAGHAAPTNAPRAVAILPHEPLLGPQEPQGTNPATIQDLLDQGQGEVRRLDVMLAQLEQREPALLNTMQSALTNANDISITLNSELHHLTRKVDTLTDTMQVALTKGSANINDLTTQLDVTVRRNSGKVDSLLASLDSSAQSLNATATAVQRLAQNPQVSANLVETTRGLAQTATTIASIAGDFHNITGNPQTQAQLRDTMANVDAATQKLNSILARLGGKSSVYGVDRGATPAPVGSPGPGGRGPGAPAGPNSSANAPADQAEVKSAQSALGGLVRNLVAVQVRISEMDAQTSTVNNSPLLTPNRGPSTDFNLIVPAHAGTYLFTGANDIGGPASSWNFFGMTTVRPHLLAGGGVLYSRLGARVLLTPRGPVGLGFEGRLYDLRRPTLDTYANLRLGDGLTIFGGERNVLQQSRRTTFGLQYQF